MIGVCEKYNDFSSLKEILSRVYHSSSLGFCARSLARAVCVSAYNILDKFDSGEKINFEVSLAKLLAQLLLAFTIS